jgi:hypothetical protein
MKARSLFLAALVTVVTLATAVGKDVPRNTGLVVVPVKGSEVFKVIYKGETTGRVKLNIYNASSRIIFSESINVGDGFICPLNFAGLEPGEYTLELVDVTGAKKVEKVKYLTSTATSKNVHVSKLVKEDGKFLVAVTNAGTEKINVRIYDGANNLVHSESREVKGDFAQLYTIKNVTGGLTFEVSDDAGYTKTIRF